MGNTQGISAALDRGRFAVGMSLRARELESDAKGQEAALRFSLGFTVSRVQICPGIGLGFARDEWESPGVTLTANAFTGRAGVGIGMEQPLYGEFSAIPFIVAQYEFTAIVYDLDDASGGDPEITGDTLSRVDIEYGLMARYKFVYAGIAAQRNSDRTGSRPYMARWIIGFAFGGGAKQSTVKSRP